MSGERRAGAPSSYGTVYRSWAGHPNASATSRFALRVPSRAFADQTAWSVHATVNVALFRTGGIVMTT